MLPLPSNKNRKNVRVFNYGRSGYYFIEDIELVRLRDGETCLPAPLPVETIENKADIVEQLPEPTEIEIPNKAFVLQELNFETAKSDILSSSFEELDELSDHLISQPDINLIIMGHTDNRGTEKLNRQLSESRAHAVALYLISKGVEQNRVTWKGLGSSRPIAGNNTEDGRRLNRRVEFKFN